MVIYLLGVMEFYKIFIMPSKTHEIPLRFWKPYFQKVFKRGKFDIDSFESFQKEK
jgi:hypothetical protein